MNHLHSRDEANRCHQGSRKLQQVNNPSVDVFFVRPVRPAIDPKGASCTALSLLKTVEPYHQGVFSDPFLIMVLLQSKIGNQQSKREEVVVSAIESKLDCADFRLLSGGLRVRLFTF